MVHFDKDGYTITVKTCGNPVDCWQELQKSIIACFYASDPDYFNIQEARPLLSLLDELSPDWETAKKMIQ